MVRMRSLLCSVALYLATVTAIATQEVDNTYFGINDNGNSLVVQSTSGILHGAVNASAPLVRQWLGVPFAQAPVGSLRFALPQPLPANASSRHLEVKAFGPSCPQYESTVPSIYNKIVREFFIWGSSGDDCLSVSIWAPLEPVKEKLPVIIWVYGGGSTTGGSSVPYQNPQKWVQRTQAHIVVSLQYRLNFFGSPNAPGLNQNLAFFDTRLALEWIRDNIAGFGGDPDKMVLWGQSAGATRVGEQSLAYVDDPIVKGYIQNSGGTYDVRSPYTDTSFKNFTFVANSFGCTGDLANLTACLRTKPQSDIESFIQYWVDTAQKPPLSFQFLTDNTTTWANGTQAIITGSYSRLPKILAHCERDGASLAACSTPDCTLPPLPALELAATQRTRCVGVAEARLRNSLNLTTYRYMYAGNFTNIAPLPWMGAYHSSELPLIMGTFGDHRGRGTPFQSATSQAMQDAYLAFAEDPEGGLAGRGWERYESGLVQVFGGSENGTEWTERSVPRDEVEGICDGYYR
ncbi:Alpha/Beta hydrolase protein [Elsinoe ampelina]|uniref:Carboxylic ester hydrolase n=1 Tax=Elsinoe ampelina TaxID=302913 RepID=A0A6A6GKE2_9PEZI|nr:Alpha/Beta hydrolase protein [Elsinoe ampelina]